MSLKLIALGCMLRDARLGMGEEGGNNRGPFVRMLLEGLDPPLAEGAPWCAAEVQSAFDNAADELGVDNPLDEVRREAYVQDYYELLQGCVVSVDEASPGDLVLYEFDNAGRWNHIGMLVRPPDSDGLKFVAVEGNTSAENQRDGDAVAVRRRGLDEGYPVLFVDPDLLRGGRE